MHRLVPLLVSAFVVLTTPSIAAEKDEYANIHTVAVVSGIGNEIRLQKIGFGLIGSNLETVPVEDWKIDPWVEANVTKAVSARFSIKSVTIDKSHLFPVMAWCNAPRHYHTTTASMLTL